MASDQFTKFVADEADFRSASAISAVSQTILWTANLLEKFKAPIDQRLFTFGTALKWVMFCHLQASDHINRDTWDLSTCFAYLAGVYDTEVMDMLVG
jgi:hypothetical protein